MKRIFMLLALVLCLIPALAGAQNVIVYKSAGSVETAAEGTDYTIDNDDGKLTIKTDGLRIEANISGTDISYIVAESSVASLTLQNVNITAPAGKHALELQSKGEVLLSFLHTGTDDANSLSGGNGHNLHGIYAQGSVKINGKVTAKGGNATGTNQSGGSGVLAQNNITILLDGDITAEGGNSTGNYAGGRGMGAMGGDITIYGRANAAGGEGGENATGGDGIYSMNGRVVIHTVDDETVSVTAIGGKGQNGGGFGIDANAVTIERGNVVAKGGVGINSEYSVGSYGIHTDNVDGEVAISGKVYAEAGKDGYKAIGGKLSLIGIAAEESEDKTNWISTTQSKLRYFRTIPISAVSGSATENLPQTGDPSMLGAWIALLGASAAAMKAHKRK